MKILKRKYIIAIAVILVVSLFFISPTLSKYKNETVRKIVNLFTRYKVNYVTAGGKINNSDNFSSYLSLIGLNLPTESDIDRIGYDFNGWYEDNSYTGSAITRIPIGSEGDKTYYASWIVSRYPLTIKTTYGDDVVNGLPEGLDLVIGKDNYGNDNVITLDSNGEIVVDKGETVSFRTTYSQDVSLSNLTIDDDIVFTERYLTGDQYIYYDFKMPKHNVTATFGEDKECVDIAKSPITFEENVDVGSITHNGFWYNGTIKGMVPLKSDSVKGNFFDWDNSENFCVTSHGVATKNQLTIVNAMKVYLEDVNMVETDTFSSNAHGSYFDTYDLLNREDSLEMSPYGNIVYDYTNHTMYTSYLYFTGNNNIVNAIVPNRLNRANDYMSTIYLRGSSSNRDNDSVTLGTIIGNYDLYSNNLTYNEYDNDFDIMFYLSRTMDSGVQQYDHCSINAPLKTIYNSNHTAYFPDTNADLGLLVVRGHNQSGRSYVRVRGDLITSYGGPTISGTSSLVVDGNLIPKSSHSTALTTINTNGYVIVKGNRFDTTNFNLAKGTVIANEIVVGRTFNLRGGTLITNQIVQSPIGYPIYSKQQGKYVYTGTQANSGSLANSNGDDYPFVTYSQADTAEGTFLISASNIYLLGYYETTETNGSNYLDGSIDLSTTNNKLRYLVYGKEGTNLPVLLDENGDLVSSPSLTSVNLEDFVDEYGTPLTETFVIGNSRYPASGNYGRLVSITGGKIYSAGNVTFYNDTNVTGGTITAAGTFGSKKDLSIGGSAIINASKVGNKNSVIVSEDSLKRYAKTTITGGTINTDLIGGVDNNSTSYVSIGGSTINGKSTNSIDIQSDTYINYFADSTIYNVTDDNPLLRFYGSVSNNTGLTVNDANMHLNARKDFTNPVIKSDSSSGLWLKDSLDGDIVNYIYIDGKVNGTSTDKIYNVDKVALYAVKGTYNLTVKSGLNYISSTLIDNSAVTLSSSPTQVTSGNTVEITLNDANMLDKTIIWYTDGNGKIHNTKPIIDRSNSKLTFDMPFADVEVYITSTMTLYLDKTPITFTNVGFNTEFGEESNGSYTFTEDSKFTYNGDYIISHSEITRMTASTSKNTSAPVTSSPSGRKTTNKVHILNNFDNTGDSAQTITLNKLVQDHSGDNSYFKLDDGAKADILIDGVVQLALVEVTENSDISFTGVHGNRSDMLYVKTNGTVNNAAVGNKFGKAGNVTYKDLKILTKNSTGSGLAYSNTLTNKTAKFINCLLERDQWYSSAFVARSFENVIIDGSDFTINQSTSWPGSIFTGVTNAKIINGSTFNYTYGATSTYAVTLFDNGSTRTTTLELIDSDINITTRRSTASTVYQERHGSTTIFENVILSGNSHLTADQKINLRNLTINDNATITINSGNGYLFAPNIIMNGGTINASHILVSGYYSPTTTSGASEAKTPEALYTALNAGTLVLNGTSYNGLTINGGTINASEFIGGDKNAKVTINGGTINAKGIGTSGKLYGFVSAMAKSGEDYVYAMDKIPATGTVVNVTGGTVNILENGYLGGMNATANITGGTVNLANGAVIGVSENQRVTLYNNATSSGSTPSNFVNVRITGGEVLGTNGKINTPYSTLNISGTNTGVNVKDIIADEGTINIQDTNSKYTCPIDSSKNVGVIATNEISGLNVNVTNNSSMYGSMIDTNVINASDTGSLVVDSTSKLYSNSYGSKGNGISTVTINGEATGNRQYSIRYTMNDNYIDPSTNANPGYYISGNNLVLSNPERYGYTFVGWFINNTQVTDILSTDTGDKALEARWIPNKVKFKVTISASDVGLTQSEFESEVSGLDGILNGNKFTFNNVVEIDYRDLLVGTNNINYTNYNLNSHNILSAKINNNTLNPDNDEINVTSSSVTREIMEYYLANNNEPIEIAIVAIS